MHLDILEGRYRLGIYTWDGYTAGDIHQEGRYTSGDLHLGRGKRHTLKAHVHLEGNDAPGYLQLGDGHTPGDIHLEGRCTHGDLHLGAIYT